MYRYGSQAKLVKSSTFAPPVMNILLAEDEPAVASFITRSLSEEGYAVSVAPDGHTALQMANAHTFDLLILDVMMPGASGLEVCRRLRASGNCVPILLLTALGSTENIVTGLDGGADDYLSKPFKTAELLARLRALTRRTAGHGSATSDGMVAPPKILSLGDLTQNIDEKTVAREGRPIELTATEFRLLEYLLRNARRVVSRTDILEAVWGYDFDTGTKLVDVYIAYLRKKIDKDFPGKLIHTAVGMGYVMKEEV
jgi:DNA-binding response OmpR family regulator